uniref:ATP synthase subunit a n=1 Tax=Ophiocordycipitaceae sp. TaxID=1907519 RepID=A0A7S8CTS9_9HYPO|nr:ATP synthase F0 subunit a [Ophiocordycipitaceae sp.]QUT09513.1 ATP synthase F0 subunit a [Ophiocordycipitaceae sp.]QUT13243.1 ATP synthase F0 subunit a [Ophiocordycipitaceae sp.]DAJ12182.1 TPA_asm: ATP synthase F0 subunit a [Ophiocordycipitaceae sp.]
MYKGSNILLMFAESPLDQFEVRDILNLEVLGGNLNLSLSNIGFYLVIGGLIMLILSLVATNYNKLVSNNWSVAQESLYVTIHSIVTNQINARKGQIYFPFIYTLFVFILINNLIGMVPYSFASTGHFALTFALSFTIVTGATILGFLKHGVTFFSILVPAGSPIALLPLLIIIEFISYMARCVSLVAGHMLLSILSGFTYQILSSGLIFFILGLIPLGFIIAFSGLEIAIAVIQAQVFVVLSSSYIKDGLDLH